MKKHKVLRETAGLCFEKGYLQARSEGWRPVRGGFSTCFDGKYINYSLLMKKTWLSILVTKLNGVKN